LHPENLGPQEHVKEMKMQHLCVWSANETASVQLQQQQMSEMIPLGMKDVFAATTRAGATAAQTASFCSNELAF